MTTEPDAPVSRITQDNLQTVSRLRNEAKLRRSWGEQAGDIVGDFVGRIGFVALHLTLFVLWAVFNTDLVPRLHPFDPYPFPLFGTLVSFEAVIISAFVLIKQTRMSRLNEHRSHVELQLTLLAEKELTHLLQITSRIAQHIGIADVVDDDTRELTRHTEIEHLSGAVGDTLREPD